MTLHFTATSDKLYDKHDYIVHLNDGRDFVFEDYEHMRSWWMAHSKQGLLSHVTIQDVKVKQNKGFG